MLPYIRQEDCLFSIYTLTSKMLPGEAFLFSEGREALLLGSTTKNYYQGGGSTASSRTRGTAFLNGQLRRYGNDKTETNTL